MPDPTQSHSHTHTHTHIHTQKKNMHTHALSLSLSIAHTCRTLPFVAFARFVIDTRVGIERLLCTSATRANRPIITFVCGVLLHRHICNFEPWNFTVPFKIFTSSPLLLHHCTHVYTHTHTHTHTHKRVFEAMASINAHQAHARGSDSPVCGMKYGNKTLQGADGRHTSLSLSLFRAQKVFCSVLFL